MESVKKCTSCGGPLLFDPESGHMKCTQCGNYEKIKFSFGLKKDTDDPVVNMTTPEETGFQGDPFEDGSEGVRESAISDLKLSDKVVETEEKYDSKIDFDSLWYGLRKGQCWGNMDLSEGENYDEKDEFGDRSFGLSSHTMDVQVYRCKSCGAEIMVNNEEISSFCAFCGQPAIVFDRASKELKPDYIIPFKIDSKRAVALIKDRFNMGTFVPNEIKNLTVEKLRGIYVPHWLYTTNIEYKGNWLTMVPKAMRDAADAKAVGGTSAYATMNAFADTKRADLFDRLTSNPQVKRQNDKLEKFYDYRYVTGTYENLAFDASLKLNDKLSQRLGPYKMDDIVDFEADFLTGFYADKFDVYSREVAHYAEKTTLEYINKVVKETCSPEAIEDSSIHRYYVQDIKYALLPAWFLTFRFEGKTYTVLVNGQNGKVVGNVPFNKPKAIAIGAGITLASMVIFAAICSLIFMSGTLLGILFIFSFGVFSAGFINFRKYLKDRNRFTSSNIKTLISERQAKTWVR